MKNIIIIDTHNMIFRNLFMCIKLVNPKKVNGKYKLDDFKYMFIDMFISNIIFYVKKFSTSNVILAQEGGSWRKELFPEYKAQRVDERKKSDVDFGEFYNFLDEIMPVVEEYFPFKFVRINNAEGDDIIAVTSEYYNNIDNVKDIIIVSTDKDFIQLFKYDKVKIFNPMSKEFIKKPKDIKKTMLCHLLVGDAADNIPKITDRSEFTPEFISFLKQNDIYTTDVAKFLKMDISKKLIKEYKGEIYKKTRFGIKSAEKYLENLEENLSNNEIHKINFLLNSKLIFFKYIPEDIKLQIIEKLQNIEFKTGTIAKMRKFCTKYGLKKLYDDIDILGLDFEAIAKRKSQDMEYKKSIGTIGTMNTEYYRPKVVNMFNDVEDL